MVSTWIIALIVALIVLVVIERELARRRNLGLQARSLLDDVGSTWQSLVQRGNDWRERVFPIASPQTAQQLHNWAHQSLPEDDPVRQWLLAMPNPQREDLTQQLRLFLGELNMELDWLLRDELAHNPPLKAQMTQIVRDYCQATMRVTQLQPRMTSFAMYVAMLERLTDRDYRAFTQELLQKLHQAQLVPQADPDMILASGQERREHVREMIEQALDKDSVRFKKVWDETMAAQEAREEAEKQAKANAARRGFGPSAGGRPSSGGGSAPEKPKQENPTRNKPNQSAAPGN